MKDQTFAMLLVVPLLALTLVLTIYPLLFSMWLSFQEQVWYPELQYTFAGLTQFSRALMDPLFRKGTIVTLRFTAETVALSVLIGMGIALVLNQAFKGRGILRALILLPWATSEFATGILWSYIFKGSTVGLLNAILYVMGIIQKPITWITPGFALETASIAFAWHMAPLAAIFLLAGLQFIPTELYRQARMDGADVFRRFWHITLPGLRHSLLIITVLLTAYAAKTIDIIIVMTGGGPGFESSTLTNLVYLRTFKELNFAQGAALSWYVIALVLVLTISVFWLITKSRRRG